MVTIIPPLHFIIHIEKYAVVVYCVIYQNENQEFITLSSDLCQLYIYILYTVLIYYYRYYYIDKLLLLRFC